MSKSGWKIISSLCFLLVPVAILAASSYGSVLKEWTRQKEEYSIDNLEMKLKWHATYLADDYRRVRHERLASLLDWLPEEEKKSFRQDREESARFDDFIVGIYAGSSADRSAGRETGHWRFRLEAGGRIRESSSAERISVTPVERQLYPHLTPWSDLYRIRFPKMIQPGHPFTLRMGGIPAKSELTWAGE